MWREGGKGYVVLLHDVLCWRMMGERKYHHHHFSSSLSPSKFK